MSGTKTVDEDLIARLEAVADKMEGKANDELQLLAGNAEQAVSVLSVVRQKLYAIEQTSDGEAHHRGPLAREAMALIDALPFDIPKPEPVEEVSQEPVVDENTEA